jgi:hypothetical protein
MHFDQEGRHAEEKVDEGYAVGILREESARFVAVVCGGCLGSRRLVIAPAR